MLIAVDAAGGDYRLQQDSPCVDGGDPVERLTEDYMGGFDIQVDLVTGILAGDTIWVTDGVNSESDEVVSTTSSTITVAYGFANNYMFNAGAYVYTQSSDFSNEPEPNGGRINIGAYGGTLEATRSGTCVGDLDGNSAVDEADLIIFAENFGRINCDIANPCDGNFDTDNDVDGMDLEVFIFNFDSPNCL